MSSNRANHLKQPGLSLRALMHLWVLLLACCGRHGAQPHAEDKPAYEKTGNRIVIPEGSPLRGRLEFEQAARAERSVTRTFTGSIEADPVRLAHVFPAVAGKLVRILVSLGDTVKEGQPVAIISATGGVTAQADYVKAKSALNLAEKSLKRQSQLLAAKVAAQKDLDEAQDVYDAAQANMEAATEVLRFMGFDPLKDAPGGLLRVLAPQSGRVIAVSAGKGEMRNDNNQPLATVADLSVVWLTIHVPERDLRLFRKNAPVEALFESYPGEKFKGTVTHLGDVITEETRVASMRVELPNPNDRLKPGMYATVTVPTVMEQTLSVPAEAILQVGADAFVFEQVAPNTLESRQVTTGGDAGGGRVIILNGLKEGAQVLKKNGVLFQ